MLMFQVYKKKIYICVQKANAQSKFNQAYTY